MFGKGIIKIIGYVVLGAIILALGAELLSSIVSIVLAFRLGNTFPFLAVLLTTIFILLGVSRLNENTSLFIIFNIFAYAVSGYLIIIVLIMTIPFGLVISFISAGICGVLCSFVKDPKQVRQYLDKFTNQIRISGFFDSFPTRNVTYEEGASFIVNSSRCILIVKEGSREKLIQLMRERPLLLVSYTHYVDCDVVFVDEKNSSKIERTTKLLTDYGIETEKITSPLLLEAIQMIPILDNKHGLKLDEYRLTTDEGTITNLLRLCPPRLTIFPTTNGLCALIPELEAPGLNVEQIRRGYESDVVLHRNFMHAREVEKQIETAT